MPTTTSNPEIRPEPSNIEPEHPVAKKLDSDPFPRGPVEDKWGFAREGMRLTVDQTVLSAAFLLSYLPLEQQLTRLDPLVLALVTLVQLLVLQMTEVSRLVWRRFGIPALRHFGTASPYFILASSLALVAVAVMNNVSDEPTFNLEERLLPSLVFVINDTIFAFFGLAGVRLIRRVMHESRNGGSHAEAWKEGFRYGRRKGRKSLQPRLKRALKVCKRYRRLWSQERALRIRMTEELRKGSSPQFRRFIVIRSQPAIRVLSVESLIYLKTDSPCTAFVTESGRVLGRFTLTQLEQDILDPREFARISASTIVRLSRVIKIDRRRKMVHLSSGDELSVGKRHMSKFLETLEKA